jgi:hypothetical protein
MSVTVFELPLTGGREEGIRLVRRVSRNRLTIYPTSSSTLYPFFFVDRDVGPTGVHFSSLHTQGITRDVDWYSKQYQSSPPVHATLWTGLDWWSDMPIPYY